MQYRPFGNTGFNVSALGFGAMRLPKDEQEAIAVIRRALDLGVNYIDTAKVYGESEIIVGKAIKGYPREQLYISSKHPVNENDGPAYRRGIEESLQRLDLDYLDVYHLHGIGWSTYETKILPNGLLDAMRQAKQDGLIRHIAFSFHDSPEALERLILTGNFESVTLQYNLLDRANEAGMALARARGMGVVVMGPVGGGRLGGASEAIRKLIPGEVRSTPEAALRFVLANPNVSTAISGMGSIAMVEENVATASRPEPLSHAEREQVAAMLVENARLADLYCTGCSYCMPCEQGVDIPAIFQLVNYYRIYGLEEYARREYAGKVAKGKGADLCQECGQCEGKCPQHLQVMEQLRQAHRMLCS